MMATLGQGALLAALVAASYSIAASIAGWRADSRGLTLSGRYSAVGVLFSMTVAISMFGILIGERQGQDIPLYFKISSIWDSQHGSMLLWTWLLTIVAAVVVL